MRGKQQAQPVMDMYNNLLNEATSVPSDKWYTCVAHFALVGLEAHPTATADWDLAACTDACSDQPLLAMLHDFCREHGMRG